METLDDVVDGWYRESAIDYVNLPHLAQDAREILGARTDAAARSLCFEIVKRLYEKGLRPGDYWGGPFDYWPDEGCEAALDRIDREWTKLGHDPTLGEPICWFARKKS
jgi:hypothetical protein